MKTSNKIVAENTETPCPHCGQKQDAKQYLGFDFPLREFIVPPLPEFFVENKSE